MGHFFPITLDVLQFIQTCLFITHFSASLRNYAFRERFYAFLTISVAGLIITQISNLYSQHVFCLFLEILWPSLWKMIKNNNCFLVMHQINLKLLQIIIRCQLTRYIKICFSIKYVIYSFSPQRIRNLHAEFKRLRGKTDSFSNLYTRCDFDDERHLDFEGNEFKLQYIRRSSPLSENTDPMVWKSTSSIQARKSSPFFRNLQDICKRCIKVDLYHIAKF